MDLKRKYKKYNVGDSVSWQFSDGEGGRGKVLERWPYHYKAEDEETGEVVEVDLRRNNGT